MEMQWPLILFTLFISWSSGLYATSNLCALRGRAMGIQAPALFASAALVVVGGIAVFFHLEHWERIFNGFGHLTSGITQELIAIVVLAVCMFATFIALRKREGCIPKTLAVVNIVVAVALVIVMGHSYMMSARPTWASFTQALSLVGNACVLGPATLAVIDGLTKRIDRGSVAGGDFLKMANVVGSAVNAVTTCAYVGFMAASLSSFTQFDRFFDGIYATKPIANAVSYSPFASDTLGMVAVAIVAVLSAVLLAVVNRKRGNGKVLFSLMIAVCGLIGAVALRMTMYATGGSVFMYY